MTKYYPLMLPAILFITLLFAPSPLLANYYRYTDDNGQVNLTNELESVPKRYRSTMAVVTEKQLEQKAAAREKSVKSEKHLKSIRQQPAVAPAQNYVETLAPTSSITTEEARTSAQAENGQGWFERQLPLLKLLAIAFAAITALVILSRLTSALAPRPLAIVIKVALCSALLVYLVKGYANKVSEAFEKIKGESSIAQKALDKRSEKIEYQSQ